MFRHAVTMGRPAVGMSLRRLIDELRKSEFPTTNRATGEVTYFKPSITAEDLRKPNEPSWTLFLDEADKAEPSAYAAQEFYELVNAAFECGHQLIVTTNYRVAELSDYWSAQSRSYGPSIMRRFEDCLGVEMF